MRKLVENSDLGIPYTSLFNKAVVRVARSLFGINKINRLYAEAEGKTGVDFVRTLLDRLGVTVQTDPERLNAIPRKGGFVLVANYPHGALDGLVLLATVARIRPDVKILGNFPLTQIEALGDFVLPIDDFHSGGRRNLEAVRRVVEHLRGGGPLIVFPAGEVATFRKRIAKTEDKPWSLSIAKLVLQSGVPAVPAYIDGRNSLIFHLLGKVHPMLRRVRLPLELTNKKGHSVAVVFGAAVSTQLLREIGQPEGVAAFLRANVYCLRSVLAADEGVGTELEPQAAEPELKVSRRRGAAKQRPAKKEKPERQKTKGRRMRKKIDLPPEPIDPLSLEQELEAIAPERMLTRIGGLCLFCAPTYAIPLMTREITRLQAAEGLVRAEEVEEQRARQEGDDELYEYLFVWDAETRVVTGAYRLGFGDRVLNALGFEGFYTYSLFEFSRHLNEVLRQSIELGYSFVVRDARRRSQTLLLLWRGMLQVMLRNPDYRYLVGAVSMREGYAMAAKWLLVDYIRANHWNAELARNVVARNAIGALGRPVVEPEVIGGVVAIEEIDKLIRDVEPSGQGMPVLMKKYLQLGGKVMGFNLDPKSRDALDVMLILDVCDVPREKLDL